MVAFICGSVAYATGLPVSSMLCAQHAAIAAETVVVAASELRSAAKS